MLFSSYEIRSMVMMDDRTSMIVCQFARVGVGICGCLENLLARDCSVLEQDHKSLPVEQVDVDAVADRWQSGWTKRDDGGAMHRPSSLHPHMP